MKYFSILTLALAACQSTPPANLAQPQQNESVQAEDGPLVTKRLDPAPTGSAYKLEEWVFESVLGDCLIGWLASVRKDKPTAVELETRIQSNKTGMYDPSCFGSFADRRTVHRAILKNILHHFPTHELTSLTLGHESLRETKEPMKVAAAKSPVWSEFLKKQKTTRFLNGNAEFVKIFNEANVGADWIKLFEEQGWRLELRSVEKVFTDQKLPYQAGIYHFKISKIP